MTQIRWITSMSELSRLGETYEGLLRAAGDDGFFYRIDYLKRASSMYLPRGSSLAFLWFERLGTPIGLAPFQISTKDWLHGGLRRLHFIGTDVGGPLTNGVPRFLIPDPNDRVDVFSGIAKELRLRRNAWDLLDLNGVPAGSADRSALQQSLENVQEFEEPMVVPLVHLRNGFEAYTASLNSRLERAVAKARRRLAASGLNYRFEAETALSPERFRQCAEMHHHRQTILQQKNEGRVVRFSVFNDPVQSPVWSSLLEWAAETGHARHYFMDIDGKLASFLLCFQDGTTLFPMLTAMDDTFEHYKPGYLVHLFAFEQEAREGAGLINQLPGTNLMKELLSNELVKRVRLEWVNDFHIVSRARCGWLQMGRRVRKWRNRSAA